MRDDDEEEEKQTENEEEEKVTAIYGIGNNTWTVEEKYLDVVARLNQSN